MQPGLPPTYHEGTADGLKHFDKAYKEGHEAVKNWVRSWNGGKLVCLFKVGH